ncbi:hypothetical protein CLF_108621 [Clonorchis sinensis]|uniref:Uncharacterized protein n=1 Tax=Clonorchis sinensis TaxID=79923 RepID=G7YI98_CLOSI|nr:hypothetical protein CLF_108621 [Clonorchis sinensis]
MSLRMVTKRLQVNCQGVEFTMLRCNPYCCTDQNYGRCAPRTSKDFQCLAIDVFEVCANTGPAMLKYVEWYSEEIAHPRDELVRLHRLRWLGHVIRMPVDGLPQRALFACEGKGKHPFVVELFVIRRHLRSSQFVSDVFKVYEISAETTCDNKAVVTKHL